jgi:hypothetical protein
MLAEETSDSPELERENCMSRKGEQENNGELHIGGNVTGSNINVGGRNIRQNISNTSGDIIQNAFGPILAQTEKIRDPNLKGDVLEILDKLKVEAGKGDKADEKRVQSWMNFLGDIAPDVWEVAVRTFINPIDGVSLVFRKIAARAKRS